MTLIMMIYADMDTYRTQENICIYPVPSALSVSLQLLNIVQNLEVSDTRDDT